MKKLKTTPSPEKLKKYLDERENPSYATPAGFVSIGPGCSYYPHSYFFDNLDIYINTETGLRNDWHGSGVDKYLMREEVWNEYFADFVGKDEVVEIPSHFPPLPKCPKLFKFVPRGFGWAGKNVRYISGDVHSWDSDLTIRHKIKHKPCNTMADSSLFYLEIVEVDKQQTENKQMTIDEQIKKAKSLVGKKVTNGGETYKVDKWGVYFPHTDTTASLLVTGYARKHDGVCVYLKDGSLSFPVDGTEEIVEDYTVTINGYVSEYFQGYVKFGCASINTPVIQKAIEFLEEQPKNSKHGLSVKIGAGTFMLDDLKTILNGIESKS